MQFKELKKPYITQQINENYVDAGKSWLGIQRGEYQPCPICTELIDRNYMFSHIEQAHSECFSFYSIYYCFLEHKGVDQKALSAMNIIKFKTKSDNPSENVCGICYCDYAQGDKIRILFCSHRFHESCIDKWFKDDEKCPLCKSDQMQMFKEM